MHPPIVQTISEGLGKKLQNRSAQKGGGGSGPLDHPSVMQLQDRRKENHSGEAQGGRTCTTPPPSGCSPLAFSSKL